MAGSTTIVIVVIAALVFVGVLLLAMWKSNQPRSRSAKLAEATVSVTPAAAATTEIAEAAPEAATETASSAAAEK